MNTTTPTKPPARLSETLFRRFESVIGKAVSDFPNAKEIPTPNPNSTACQLRAAMKSYNQYAWPSDVVDRERFLSLYKPNNLVVREFDGKVRIGSRQTTKDQIAIECCSFNEPNPGIASGDAVTVRMNEFCDQDERYSVIKVVADLAAQRALCKPIHLVGLLEYQAEYIKNNYDVLLEQVKPNEYILT